MDPIFTAILGVVLIGLLCWVVITFIPMADPFPRIVIAVAVVLTILWLLRIFGVAHLP